MESFLFTLTNPIHCFSKTPSTPFRLTTTASIRVQAEAAPISLQEEPLPVIPPRLMVKTDSLQYPAGYIGAFPNPSSSGNDNNDHIAMSYVRNILSSKVYDVAVESPLELAPKLSKRLGVNVWLKREDLQPVFSFKIRGAYHMMANLPREQLEKGVICSSAGNHAQAVALSAKKLNCTAVVVMPVTTPDIKWKSVESLGATVVLLGDSYEESQTYAKKRAITDGLTFVPGFDHPDIIIGQGTVGMEIVRQMKEPLHAIFVPIGGGGLISGIAAYVKMISPQVKVFGVEPTDANTMALSFHHGERVILDQVGGFAEGVAIKEVGEENFRICMEHVDGIVLVNRDSLCASIKDMFEENRGILEPSGALALAGAEAYCKYYGVKGENVVAITTGANMNFDKLRMVTELADVGRRKEALFATILSEEAGSFKQFCQLLGHINITELKYRYNNKEKAVLLYSVGVDEDSELKAMEEKMELSELPTSNLTESELVKDHLRYLMGGQANIENEVVCRFIFPERPGALMNFLDCFSPRWSITLFHYRGKGEMGANVLVGMHVPQNEMDEFRDRANKLGYDYTVVNDDHAFQLLAQK
ncbi:unnamed protein product [Lupinus luteus]|uniref:Threonine dehydratase n=1 Tax=Lupinus luteus TaxID=3873 RepID=A0AAV1WSQ7_LUPLU